MRPPKARSLSVGLAGALAVASLGALSCSSSDTILALTISSASDVAAVSKLNVTITSNPPPNSPPAFGPIMREADVQTMMTPDGGTVIKSSYFVRLTLPESTNGPATVVVEALDASGNPYAGGRGDAVIQKDHTVAAQVMLTVGGPPPETDGGAGGHGAGGEAGGHGGEAGAAGGHGGEAGGAGGEAGAAGGAAGRRGGGNRGGAGGGQLGIGGLGGAL